MHAQHQIPHLVVHLLEGLVPQDAGVGNEKVQLAEAVHRRLDHGPGVFFPCHIAIVSNRLAASCLDLVHHLVCHGSAGARAITGATQIIHHNGRPLPCQQQSMTFTKPATCASDQRNLTIQHTHQYPP